MFELLKDYFEARLKYFQMTMAEQAGENMADFVVALITGLLVAMLVLFISLALAFFISDKLGSYFLGFSAVAAIYLGLFLLLSLLKKPLLKNPIRNRIILKIMNSKNKTNNTTHE